jgi:hypothetical protein
LGFGSCCGWLFMASSTCQRWFKSSYLFVHSSLSYSYQIYTFLWQTIIASFGQFWMCPSKHLQKHLYTHIHHIHIYIYIPIIDTCIHIHDIARSIVCRNSKDPERPAAGGAKDVKFGPLAPQCWWIVATMSKNHWNTLWLFNIQGGASPVINWL